MSVRRWIKRVTTIAVTVGAAAAVAVIGPTSASATEGYCGLSWGSLAKSATPTTTAPMTNVRAGRHFCWDRLVIDMRSPGADGYRVEYVDNVYMDGSGQLVPLRGGAKLQIVAMAPAYDGSGNSTYSPSNPSELVNVAGWQTFRQVAWAGSFEGQTTIGLGVRARLPFRVFSLDGPPRLIIDVAHRWS